MSYLEQYDAASPADKVTLVSGWIRTDWRPFFKELREQRPILATPGFTLVTRFPDVTEVLSRERIFSVRPYAPRMDPVVAGPFMLARDDTPVNWREKGIMQAMLMPEDLERVRLMVHAFAEESLRSAAPHGRIEVVNQLGRFVPIKILGAHFGFPGPDLKSMYRWSRATQSDMFKNLQNDPAVHEASVQAGKEMMSYLADLIEQKRAALAECEPGTGAPQDVFSRLIRTQFPAELGFDDHRVLANVAGLLIGSGETTAQAISQALEQILLRPEVCDQAISAAHEPNPERFDQYVWEALRFNPINPLVFRLCETDYTVAAGTPREARIPAGTLVFACTASAMFDEDVVAGADSFRLDRPDFSRLHFGYGHHTCLGRHVAGVMIPEVIRRVLRRPAVRLLPPPEGSIDFQGGPFPERFGIAFGAASADYPSAEDVDTEDVGVEEAGRAEDRTAGRKIDTGTAGRKNGAG